MLKRANKAQKWKKRAWSKACRKFKKFIIFLKVRNSIYIIIPYIKWIHWKSIKRSKWSWISIKINWNIKRGHSTDIIIVGTRKLNKNKGRRK